MSQKFNVEAWYCSATVILNDGDYVEIKRDINCSIAVDSHAGIQYFLAQKINLNDGSEYILERYKVENQTIHYRRRI